MKFSAVVGDKQASVGLPREPLYDLALLYDGNSEVVVLSCSVHRLGAKIPKIYVRRQDTQYEPVADYLEEWRRARYTGFLQPSIEIGMYTPIVGANSHLYFLVNEITRTGDSVGGNVVGVASLDLVSRACEVWDTRVPAGSASCEATRLIGADGSGAVYAVAGFPNIRTEGAGYSVSYGIARLRFEGHVVERVMPMPHIFY